MGWKGLQVYMRDKEPLGKSRYFKPALVLWNVCLSVLSWVCFYNIGIALRGVHRQLGTYHMCYQSDMSYGGAFQGTRNNVGWLMVFMVSKVPEMIDTFWLVLNKKEIITLQWWHHLTVMFFCWAQGVAYPDSGDGPLFAFFNSGIHSIMYPYYALALVTKVARVQSVRIAITLLQISQMFVGVVLRYLADANCKPIYPDRQRLVGYAGWIIYTSYLILFVKFFVDSYIFNHKSVQKSGNGKVDKKMQ